MILKDLIPTIDATYRTLPDRDHRAIAGLSMGGGQALQIGLNHLDTFSAVASFSGVRDVDPKTAYEGVLADPAAFDQKVHLLYLHSGTVGLDATIHKSATNLSGALQQSGIKNVVFRDAEGLAHGWQTWRGRSRKRKNMLIVVNAITHTKRVPNRIGTSPTFRPTPAIPRSIFCKAAVHSWPSHCSRKGALSAWL